MKHIKLFETTAAYEEARQNLVLPNVSYCNDVKDVYFHPYHDYSQDYFTTVALSDGTIKFSGSTSGTTIRNTLSYSTDGGENWSTPSSSVTVTVTTGEKVLWKGETKPREFYGIGSFTSASTASFNVEGNVMSLLYGDDFKTQTSLSGKKETFRSLFWKNTQLVSAKNLSLPATTLGQGCYIGMFAGCINLTTAPSVLPATTLANSCYYSMFNGCTSLTTAPQLPATTLADVCYQEMFNECTSLTAAPKLPATTLADSCYQSMFYGCTSLAEAPQLPATTLHSGCYGGMFQGCTSLTTAPELHATTLATSCYSSMFRSCTNLTTAPELPATTLATSCYKGMFFGCTSLETAPELHATSLYDYSYSSMFFGCTSLNSITCLATDISAMGCTKNWVNGVANSGTFTKAASMTSWTTGISGIPDGWNVEDK